MVEAIFYVLRVAVAWRDLPPCYGPWNSVYTRWRRWCALGLWQEILRLLSRRAERPRAFYRWLPRQVPPVRDQSRRRAERPGHRAHQGRTQHQNLRLGRGPGPTPGGGHRPGSDLRGRGLRATAGDVATRFVGAR